MNNAWTLRLTDTVRFGFYTYDGLGVIRDRQRPQQEWTFDFMSPYHKVTRDYGVIS